MNNLEIVRFINYIFALIFIFCVGYQFVYILIPFLKGEKKLKAKKMYRYAVLIPARNEEKVIPHLIASIKGQTYPSELVDIFVIADNCTDNTAKIAREHGAVCYERFNKKEKTKVKIKYSKFIIITVIVYSVFYAVVSSGQNEGKLFIQEHLFLDFDENKTALILGAIICVTRVVRVISNVIFAKIYKKCQEKMGAILAGLLSISMASMVFGSFIPQVIVKILVMSFGYTIILFARDPFRLYMQDVVN